MTKRDTIADSAALPKLDLLRQKSDPHHRARTNGVETLSDADLLAVVLGTGGGGMPLATLAASLIEDGVGALTHAGIGELSERRGIGPAKALRIAAAIELGRRSVEAASRDALPRLVDRDSVVSWARPRLATLDHEELWALCLDGRHGLRAARRVASGGIHGLHIGVRDVLRVVLREAASAFILVHNHPSGDPAPSDEDVAFTRAVAQGAAMIGTPLIDHVIVARRSASSMMGLGLVPSR